MDSAQAELDTLVERLRTEIRRRKLELEEKSRLLQEPPPKPGPLQIESHITSAPEVDQSPPQRLFDKQHFKRAHAALERALKKNARAEKWPRFLRALRRNQGAINDSIIHGARAFLEICKWMDSNLARLQRRVTEDFARREEHARRLIELDERIRVQAQQVGGLEAQGKRQERRLHDLERKLVERARQATEQEERCERQQRQIDELRQSLEQLAPSASTRTAGIAQSVSPSKLTRGSIKEGSGKGP